MKTLLLALACLASVQDGWWNGDWAFRRRIAVKNNLDTDLAGGYPVLIEIDAEYLGIQEKAKKDFSDLAVVHEGKRIPCAILPGRSAGCRVVAFRTAADLRPGARDEGYALYYGNAAAAAVPDARHSIFDFHEDFADPDALAKKFDVDKDLTAKVQDGALVIREVAAGRTENTPARIVLKGVPASAGFSLSFDLEIDSSTAAAPGFTVNVDLKEPGVDDAAAAKKAVELIDKLGEADWEARETATKELIKLGRPAIAKLMEAARADDAEVKWRAEHILKMIRERSPSPTIAAGVVGADSAVGPVALLSRIGGARSKTRHSTGWPARVKVTVLRDPDGEVSVLWNNGRRQTGSLKGDVREISFSVWKGSASPLGSIRVDNIELRRHVDDDARPTHTLQVEEKKP